VLPPQINASPPPTWVTLLAFNDFHNQFGPAPKLISTLNTLKTEAKAREDDVFCFSGGDNNTGAKLQHWPLLISLLNLAGLDASAVGNHDLDSGLKPLLSAIKQSSFPWLSCNLKLEAGELPASKESNAASEPWLTGTHTLTGKKHDTYGVIGVTTPVTQKEAIGRGDTFFTKAVNVLFFDNAVKQVQKQVDALEAKGINKIILLSHLGYQSDGKAEHGCDLELAKRVHGVDVIIGGHTHQKVGDLEKSLTQGSDKRPVLITQAGKDGQLVSQAIVPFDSEGHIIVTPEIRPDLSLHTTEQALPCPKAEKLITEALGDQTPLALFDKAYEPFDLFHKETPLGNFMADEYLRWAVQAHQADFALLGPTTLRSPMPKALTPLALEATLPYANYQVIETTGQALLEAFKTVAEKKHDYYFEQHKGAPPELTNANRFFPQHRQPYMLHPSGNLRVKLDVAGQQVLSLELADGQAYLDGKQPAFKAIEPKKTYRVAYEAFPLKPEVAWYPSLVGAKPITEEFSLAEKLLPQLREQGAGQPLQTPQTLQTDGRLQLNY
jgi:5'-nucleotidase / UDP-sugar diphosphatase